MHKLCFIGLGNPGSKYDNTRHNIGKDWLIKLSESYCDNFIKKSKLEAEITQSRSDEILWIIPDNYVNDSYQDYLSKERDRDYYESIIIIR